MEKYYWLNDDARLFLERGYLKENQSPEERIKEGEIDCQECNASYPIWNYIPRFSVSTPYADSFGPQWKTFAKSQIDTPKNCESQIRLFYKSKKCYKC